MKPLTYPKAVGGVLERHGFIKRPKRTDWFRREGEYEDVIDLQLSSCFIDITSNIWVSNMAVDAFISNSAAGQYNEWPHHPVSKRVSHLMGPLDHWWKRSDPDGPANLAAAIEEHAVPFVDRMHSLSAMADHLGRFAIKWRSPKAQMHLAVIRSRLGDIAGAVETLDSPAKRLRPEFVLQIKNLQDRIRAGETIP